MTAGKKNVGVFIDYMNAFNRARDAFAGVYPSSQDGQFHPSALAHEVAGMARDRSLAKVTVYRGQPDPRRDPKGAGATQRQIAGWKAAGVEVKTRPLGGYQYGEPKEKGIDVLIAVDLVVCAMARRYDVLVLVSADSDLVPGLEWADRFSSHHVALGKPPIEMETVVWMPPGGRAQRLRTGQVKVTERAITRPLYEKLHDPRDYARA